MDEPNGAAFFGARGVASYLENPRRFVRWVRDVPLALARSESFAIGGSVVALARRGPGPRTMARAKPSTPPRAEILLADDRVVSLGAEIGRGVGATVYRGVLESPYRLRRPVACKIFSAVPSDSRDEVVTAVARAARWGALVDHPNVAATYEITVLGDSQPVILSELVDGWPLGELLRAYTRNGRRLPLDVGLFIASEIAEGLAGARETRTVEGIRREIVHHDLSPRDVLLSRRGEVKITDFGISRALRSGSSIRSIRALTERIVTMAPEIVRGSLSDARSDVFSLGIMMREMLVGPRFAPNLSDQDAVKQAREGHVEIGVFEPKLPEPLASILRRAIEIDPKARYPHAGALAYELRRACLSLGVGDGRLFLRNAIDEHLVRHRFFYEDDEPTAQVPPFVFERADEPLHLDDGLSEDDEKVDVDPEGLDVTHEVRVSGVVATIPDDDEDDDGLAVPPAEADTAD